MIQQVCKKSKDCDAGDVCDRSSHLCREPKIRVGVTKAVLARECLQKGIPISYERGPRTGERKTKDALRRCKSQKDRTVLPYQGKMLGAPPVKSVPSVHSAHSLRSLSSSSSSSSFSRPPLADLNKMRKDELTRLFKEGQKAGFIDKEKDIDGLTNKQLANIIHRATQKKW